MIFEMKKLKTITSHTGLSRWLAETSEPIAYAPRCVTEHIPSPYRYSPSVPVYLWRDKRVVWFEVAHKRYCVYEAPPLEVLYAIEDNAIKHHITGVAPWPSASNVTL
jgi:hypothetical protein